MGSPSADIRLNIAANSAAAQLDMITAKSKRMMRAMESGSDKVNRKAKATSKSIGGWSSGLGKAVGGLMVMGGILKGIQTTSELIRKELQAGVDLSNMANEVQVPYEDRLKEFFFQSVPATVKDREGFVAKIDEMIQNSNVRDKSAALEIIQTTTSTMGDVEPIDRAKFGLSIAVGRKDALKGDNLEALKTFAGVAGMAHLNFAGEGSTAMAQLALMNATITSSAVADMTSFSRNIAPLGNQTKLLGGNQVEGLGLAAALSTSFNDQTGQMVGTAQMNILGKLREVEARFGVDSKGQSLEERHTFITSQAPKAVQAQKYLLGIHRQGMEQMTDAERESLSKAQLNARLLPKVGGRAKSLYSSLQFFQPTGPNGEVTDLVRLWKSSMREIGAIRNADGGIDERATYERLDANMKKFVEIANTSELFKSSTREMNTAEAVESMNHIKSNTVTAGLATPDSEFDTVMKQAGKWGWIRSLSRQAAHWSNDESLEESLERKKGILKSEIDKQLLRTIKTNVRPHSRFKYAKAAGETDVYEESRLREFGFTKEQVDSSLVLQALLEATVTELRGLRADQKAHQNAQKPPKEVIVRVPGQLPAKPAAAAIGK